MLAYFPGMKDFTITITNAAIIMTKTTPLEINNDPRGTPELFSVSPAVCAVGISVAYSWNRTTSKTILSIAVLIIPGFNPPFLMLSIFIFIFPPIFKFYFLALKLYFFPMNDFVTIMTKAAIIIIKITPVPANKLPKGTLFTVVQAVVSPVVTLFAVQAVSLELL